VDIDVNVNVSSTLNFDLDCTGSNRVSRDARSIRSTSTVAFTFRFTSTSRST